IVHNCLVLLLCLVSYHSATHAWRDWLAMRSLIPFTLINAFNPICLSIMRVQQ
ncbi:hypothetical protein FOZ63_029732, partial [Perkinsus olseni]